jgi:hypothetical protein
MPGDFELTHWQPVDILSIKTSNETRYVREKKMAKAIAAVTATLTLTVPLQRVLRRRNGR